MTHRSTSKLPTLVALLLVGLCSTGFYYAYQANTRLTPVLPPLAATNNLQRWLLDTPEQLLQIQPLHHLHTISKVYDHTGYNMLWMDGFKLTNPGKQLLQQLTETSADQLLDYQYHLSYIQQRLHNLQYTPRSATALDILMTDAFISYAEDVLSDTLLPAALKERASGIRPVAYHGHYDPINHDDIVKLLAENQHPRKLSKVLNNMAPTHDAYKGLRLALEQYQDMQQSWQPMSTGPTLRPGEKHPQIQELRSMLRLYGDYPLQQNALMDWLADDEPTTEQALQTLDKPLTASLRQFQQRHGMSGDGVLDQATRQLLNTPPSQRIRQIALNMKRWRELPTDLGSRYIWVNMTDYQLQLVNRGRTELDMKVIIGKTYRRTPQMHEAISTLVLNPHWNVPSRIARQDILPKVKKNPDYLKQNNMRVLESWGNPVELDPDNIDWSQLNSHNFTYRFQQDPGPGNALGTVKFVIPNDSSIYLHDTSQPELFKRNKRAFSSGCVRVEKPMALARALLKGKRGWGNEHINETLASGETRYVRLPEKVPTYLTYLTAWVDKEQRIQFREDIYKKDKLVVNSNEHALQL